MIHCCVVCDVPRKLNQAFLLFDRLNFNFVDEERSDIYAICSVNVVVKNF